MRILTLTALGIVALYPLSAIAAPTGKFLQDAIKGDNSEMRLGALAATRAVRPATRAYGRTLQRDHAKAKVDAVALARRNRVAVPTTMMPEAQAEYRRLSRLRGAAFDREFARYMVDDHHKDIADFREQVRTGRDGTAALARKSLPTLRKHLRLAQSLG